MYTSNIFGLPTHFSYTSCSGPGFFYTNKLFCHKTSGSIFVVLKEFNNICSMLFIGLPWLIFHYITKWKTAGGGITTDDEALLEELYALTKRLDDRMDTVERLVAHDHADFKPARLIADNKADNEELDELEALLARKRAEHRETRA